MANEKDLTVSIENEEKAVRESNTYLEKMSLQNNVLQLKIASRSHRYKSDFYLDLKLFIVYYLKSLDERKQYYDELNIEKIYSYLEYLTKDEKVKIIKFLIRQLKLNGLEELADDCGPMLAKLEIDLKFSTISLKNLFSLLYLLTTYNIWTIFTSFVLLFAISFFFLLPTPTWSIQLVAVDYEPISKNPLLNHFLNILGAPVGMVEKFKVTPLSISGYLLCLLGKVTFYIVILNVLVKNLEEKIKI